MTDSKYDTGSNETRAFVFDILVGFFVLCGVGYIGFETGAFTRVSTEYQYLSMAGGLVLGTASVLVLESESVRGHFDTSLLGIVTAVMVMCSVAAGVWLLSQASTAQAMYAILGVMVAALITRTWVFVQRSTPSEALES